MWPVFHFKRNKKQPSMICLLCCHVPHFPCLYYGIVWKTSPVSRWRLPGGEWSWNLLCTLHAHKHTRILPHFQLKPLWNKKREQQRSIGNFSTGLFWKTVHTFICWSLAFGSMQQLQWILENLYGLGNVIKPCIHLLLDCWSSFQCVHYLTPLPTDLNVKKHLYSQGKKIYSMLLCACVLLSRERGNATVSPEGCLHFGPWHINENLAAGKPGVLRWVCTC